MGNPVADRYYGAKFASQREATRAIAKLVQERIRLDAIITEYETKCAGYEEVWSRIKNIRSLFASGVTSNMMKAITDLENNYTGSESANNMKTSMEANLNAMERIEISIDSLIQSLEARKAEVQQLTADYIYEKEEVIDTIAYINYIFATLDPY